MDTPLVDVMAAGAGSGSERLGGRYQLRALLGTGGMAQVYDGWDDRLSRPVAVKLLRPDLAVSADLRRRFELEARAAARLTHPNVVSVYDAGEDDGQSYIVMERLPGESLADSIARGPVDMAWLRRLGGEVLAALGAAHEAGIVHRDIKPGNILLGPDGRAKVSDFGIARIVEPPTDGEPATNLTGAGLVVGTPAYLSPEQAMGQPATPQSDLYALGVVLYEALTGTKPYAGATPAAIAAAMMNGAVQNPLVLRPDADPELVGVIGRAMALDPAQRYPSALAMAADLRGHAPAPTSVMSAVPAAAFAVTELAGRPGPAAPPPPPRSPTRRPAMFAGRRGLVLLGVAAVVAAALFLVVSNPGSKAASSTATTTAPSTTRAPATHSTQATTATTATTATAAASVPAVVQPLDTVGVALDAIARQLARSQSPAAASLANALTNLASLPDGSARTAAATNLVAQAYQWYQQSQLSAPEYSAARAVLHLAGAPLGPPPTARHTADTGGNGGGGN